MSQDGRSHAPLFKNSDTFRELEQPAPTAAQVNICIVPSSAIRPVSTPSCGWRSPTCLTKLRKRRLMRFGLDFRVCDLSLAIRDPGSTAIAMVDRNHLFDCAAPPDAGRPPASRRRINSSGTTGRPLHAHIADPAHRDVSPHLGGRAAQPQTGDAGRERGEPRLQLNSGQRFAETAMRTAAEDQVPALTIGPGKCRTCRVRGKPARRAWRTWSKAA